MPDDDNASGASNVGIFVRVRPVQRASKNVAVSPEDGELHFHIPRDEADGYAAALRVHVAPLQACCVPRPTTCCQQLPVALRAQSGLGRISTLRHQQCPRWPQVHACRHPAYAHPSPTDTHSHLHNHRRYINNQREDYKFLFNGVLRSDSKQAEVFERVCRPAVETFLSGINSTIFAYGQTGSGKTFTITGGPERYEGATPPLYLVPPRSCRTELLRKVTYTRLCALCARAGPPSGHNASRGTADSHHRRADRGLIPRSISHLFHAFKALTDASHAVHVSYMELYNGQAYDLLDPSREIAEMADLPRVTILEDDEGRYHMRGLSLHPCAPPPCHAGDGGVFVFFFF